MHHQNVSWNQAFKFLNQASGTGAYHGTRHSYLGTRLQVTGDFSERENGERIVSSLSEASQQFEWDGMNFLICLTHLDGL